MEILLNNYGEQLIQHALKSPANKRKVGCIIFDMIHNTITYGHNYITPAPKDFPTYVEKPNGVTSNYTIHAEENAIFNQLTIGPMNRQSMIKPIDEYFNEYPLVMITTYSPCANCAKMIVQSGIKCVIIANIHVNNFLLHEYHNNILIDYSVKDYLETNGVNLLYIDTEKYQMFNNPNLK